MTDIKDVLIENEELKARNEFLESELLHYKSRNIALAQRCRRLTVENHDLSLEIKDMKFTRKYLTSEEAGRQFAQELLGGK